MDTFLSTILAIFDQFVMNHVSANIGFFWNHDPEDVAGRLMERGNVCDHPCVCRAVLMTPVGCWGGLGSHHQTFLGCIEAEFCK